MSWDSWKGRWGEDGQLERWEKCVRVVKWQGGKCGRIAGVKVGEVGGW